jgi:hypothetical protein
VSHEDVDSDAHEVAGIYELDGDHDFSTGLLGNQEYSQYRAEEREEKGKKRS